MGEEKEEESANVQIDARRRGSPAPPPAPPPEQPAHPWAKKKANEIGQEHHSIGAAEEGESEKAGLLMEVEDKKGQEKNEKAALQMEVEDEKIIAHMKRRIMRGKIHDQHQDAKSEKKGQEKNEKAALQMEVEDMKAWPA